MRKVRLAAGVRQDELAARLGRPQSFVSKVENGERSLDAVELVLLCRALGVQAGALIKEIEDRLTED